MRTSHRYDSLIPMVTRSTFALLLVSLASLLLSAFAACGGGSEPSAIVTLTPLEPTTPPNVAAGSSWPMLAHDVSSNFQNADETTISTENVGQLTELWHFETSGSVTGTPAVVGDTVYVLAGGGTYALDADTGEVRWDNSDVGGTSSPTYAGGTLFVSTSGGDLYALNAKTGDVLWQAEIDPHPRASGFSSPVVVGDLVLIGSSSSEEAGAINDATFRGALVAYDRESGDEVWRHYTVAPPFNGVSMWSTASVDLDANVVYGDTGNNYTGEASDTSDSIFALDLETGDVLWNTQLTEGDVFTIGNPQSEDTDFGTNPILFKAEIDGTMRPVVGAGQKSGMFWVLDRETGEVVWNVQVSDGSPLIGGVFNNGAFDGERLIMAGNNATSDAPGGEPANGESEPLGAASIPTSVLTALNPADGTVAWERQLPAWVWAPVTLANGVGFVSAESELQAFDVATGEKLFSFDTNGTIASGAAIANGRVYFGSGVPYFLTTPDNTFYALGLP
ncbi:MAG: PQQ-binding-like beta-propeller repeat protein [Dehalococcoidia bacterium]